MSQIDALLLKAKENVNRATLLLNEELTEIAPARAYYAMFCIAEALLFTRGLVYSSHSAVIAAYGKEFARPALLDPVHRRHLLDAFEARQLGDYGVDSKISREQVERNLGWAVAFLGEASEFIAQGAD